MMNKNILAAVSCLIITLLCSAIGCVEEARRAPVKPAGGTTETNSTINNQKLEEAMGYLDTLDEFNLPVVKTEILNKMNRWLFAKQLDPAWQVDPLVVDLPEEVLESPMLQELTSSFLRDVNYPGTIRGGDFDYLVGVFWASRISKYIADNTDPSEDLKKWVQEKHAELTSTEQNDLLLASLLFDWTVENIQLRKTDPAVLELFKPGTSRDVWECLQLGYGDEVQRARVFISLARQKGIHVVMLEVPNDKNVLETRTPAALIGKKLFVFDSLYGLPISTADGSGIATLKEIVADEAVLASMNSSKYKYSFTKESFAKAAILIDAPSASLMQATALIDSQLSGDQKLSLHVKPSDIVELLKERSTVVDARIWELPFVAEDSVRQRLRDQSFGRLLIAERAINDSGTPYGTARLLQLMCRFNQDSQRRGARQMYLMCRKIERDMSLLSRSQQVEQLEMEGFQLSDDPKAVDLYLNQIKSSSKVFKEYSSYQLGLIALLSQEYDSSIDYLSNRTIQEFPETKYLSSAHYNLAKSYLFKASEEDDSENISKAIEQLTHEDDLVTPQRRGNTLLAERLQKLLETAE